MTGPELAAWRKQYGYTQAALAHAIGFSVTAIARWEGGSRVIPAHLPITLAGLLATKPDSKGANP